MIESLLRMSVTGTAVIAVVLVLRLCLRRVPKIFCYALWAIVLFRLLCPVSVALPMSVFNLLGAGDAEREAGFEGQLPPRSEPGNGQAALSEQQMHPTDVPGAAGSAKQPAGKTALAQGPSENQTVSEVTQERASDGWKGVCTVLWLIGVSGMLFYGAFDMRRLRRRIRGASLDRDNIYLLEGITSPFVAGIFRPRIYLPYGLSGREREYVLLHERTHIRRGDPLFRALAYLALSLHWFNPLVWAAFFVSARDMEMACDETVLRRLGEEIKREYSSSLLVMAQGKGLVTNISLAFGEGDTGKRIKNVLSYKKTSVRAVIAGVFAVALALVALGTNPVEQAAAGDFDDSVNEGKQDEEAIRAAGADVGQADALSIELLCQMADRGELEACDFRAFSNAVYDSLGDDALNYYEQFTFTTGLGELALDVSYMKGEAGEEDDVLDAIYLTRRWDAQMLLIYSRDARYGTGTAPTGADIEQFLAADFDILNEISFDLPDGLTLEPYSANVGDAGGRLFSPDVYEGEEHTPADWMAAGSVSRYDGEQLLVWEDGSIKEVLSFQNHAVITGMNQVDDLDAPAMLVSMEYDLHTAPEMYELDQKGIAYEPTSSYWCLYIAKEGMPCGYMLSLNQKNFTEEDMLSLAKTVRFTDGAAVPKPALPADDTDQADGPDELSFEAKISIRSISRSLPGIDRYVAPDEEWESTYGDSLIFADDCKYFINYGRERMSPQEVNFITFAEAIEQGDPYMNKPCVVEIYGDDRQVHSITLQSGRYQNGVSCVQMGPWGFFEDTAALYPDYEKAYPIVRTETMDISSAPGEETIEIRRGRRESDGLDEAVVDFRDQNGNILYSCSILNEGMCLVNLYAGRMDGAGDPFLLEVRMENRDIYGEYSYYVYTLGSENGTFLQSAGSSIAWEKDGPLVYDAVEMDIFLHMLGHYLADSHLLAGTEWKKDGTMGIRTEAVCDEDRFTYEKCRPTCFPDPYETADVR